jgi:hypothetical protein
MRVRRARGHEGLKLPRKRWLVLVAAVATFAIAAPVAFATFFDVPPSNPFYADVNAVQGAGITSGCGGGNFCPGDNITRQAEAAFVHRGSPRIAQSAAIANIVVGPSAGASTDTVVGSVTIDVGGVSGGHQFVKVDAHAAFTWKAGTTPFFVAYYIADGTCSGAGGQTFSDTIVANPGDDTASATWTEQVPTGGPKTFVLCAFTDPGNSVNVESVTLDATTYAFGSGGAATLRPATTASAQRWRP